MLIVEVKFQSLALDEPLLTTDVKPAPMSQNDDANRAHAVDTLPDVVRDVDRYLPVDAPGFAGESPPDVERDVEASWSKEVLSSVIDLDEPRDCWNWNGQDRGDDVIVTINPGYDNESDASSSRSSMEDQFESLSSVGDACSKGQSSVAEPVDLSDTEQPLLTGNESTGHLEPAVEQVMTEPRQHFVTTLGTEKVTETREDTPHTETTRDVDTAVSGKSGEEMLHEAEPSDDAVKGQLVDRPTSGSLFITSDEDKASHDENSEELRTQRTSAEPNSSTTDHAVSDGGASQELDAYLSGAAVIGDHDDDDVAATNYGLGSKDDPDIINTVGIDADVNDVEVDQTETMTGHTSAEIENVYRSADDDEVGLPDADDACRLDKNGNVCVEAGQTYRVDYADSFLRSQTTVTVNEQDVITSSDADEAAELHGETAAADLGERVDRRDLVENSNAKSPVQLAGITLSMLGDRTYDDAVLTDCRSTALTTELGVEMADAEVDAIFSGGTSTVEHDRCHIRRVSTDERDLVDRAGAASYAQFSQTSDTSDADDFVSCASFRVTLEEQSQSAVEEKPELNNESHTPDIIPDGTSEEDRMNRPSVCTSEAPGAGVQFEGDGETADEKVGDGQDTEAESVGVSRRQLAIHSDHTDEQDVENGQTNSDLAISLPVEPSNETREAWVEDDSETAKAETVGGDCPQEDDQTAASAANVSSPDSNLSWRSCTSGVCELEKNAEDHHVQLEHVSTVRGVTASQVWLYRKFCEDRRLLDVDYSDATENTVEMEPDEDDECSFPYVDTVDVLPPEDPDSNALLLNSDSLLPECRCSGFSEGCLVESCVYQNKSAEVTAMEDEMWAEESFPADEDLDEVASDCSPDIPDCCGSEEDAHVPLVSMASECSKTFTSNDIGIINILCDP